MILSSSWNKTAAVKPLSAVAGEKEKALPQGYAAVQHSVPRDLHIWRVQVSRFEATRLHKDESCILLPTES